MPRLTCVDTTIAYSLDPADCSCKDCVAWTRERGRTKVPRWGERMDRLEQALDCYHTDIFDAYVCDRCNPQPTSDPKADTRATAAQGMARPWWTNGRPPAS